jgi:hypothetical protein
MTAMPTRRRRALTPQVVGNAHGGDDLDTLPPTTRWYRDHGRCTRREKAAKEQYLTPNEEKALAAYVLRMPKHGFPLPVKVLRSLAPIIRQRRTGGALSAGVVHPPGKNWPQGFYKRNPELVARRVKAMAWNRHDHTIYQKTVDRFSIIGGEFANPAILPENVYNMAETGVLLSVLGALKVLVGRDDLRNYRGVGSKRTLITAIECISGDGRCLEPLVIWPAATHRSTWTTHPTPGWHYACSDTGYSNSSIALYWIRNVFDPLTKARAGGKPRVLISDGFASHESLEVMTFCFENNINLCRLPSHTSHKLQPCDVAVFGPLKTAYREQVERLFRGGADTIGKQHFTLLYSHAREAAMTARNIRSGWSKAGLFPFNPDRVLRSLAKPPDEAGQAHPQVHAPSQAETPHVPPKTPTSASGLNVMRQKLDQILGAIDENESRLHIQKIVNAAEQSLTSCALLQEENRALVVQNREKKIRKSTKATKVGTAKIMSYEDIVQAKAKRDEKAVKTSSRKPRKQKGAAKPLPEFSTKPFHQVELEIAERQIASSEFSEYCNVLCFA